MDLQEDDTPDIENLLEQAAAIDRLIRNTRERIRQMDHQPKPCDIKFTKSHSKHMYYKAADSDDFTFGVVPPSQWVFNFDNNNTTNTDANNANNTN